MERVKAGNAAIDGVEPAGPQAVEDGKRIMEFRMEAAVKAIPTQLAEGE